MTAPGHPWATLTVVGAGTLLPSADFGSASFHVQVGGTRGASPEGRPGSHERGHSLLLDVGPGTLHGLPRAGVAWRAIDTVAITHFHPDHVSDLPALFAAYRYEGIETPLTVVGPPGLRVLLERMASLHGPWILEPARPLTVVELSHAEEWSSPDGTLTLHVHDTRHTPESVAFRVEVRPDGAGDASPPSSIGYTGDTGPMEGLATFVRACDVVIAECSLTDPPTMETHLSPQGVAALAREAEPKLLLVSHVYPPQTPDQAVRAVRAVYPGRVEAARDGDRCRIDPTGVASDGGGSA